MANISFLPYPFLTISFLPCIARPSSIRMWEANHTYVPLMCLLFASCANYTLVHRIFPLASCASCHICLLPSCLLHPDFPSSCILLLSFFAIFCINGCLCSAYRLVVSMKMMMGQSLVHQQHQTHHSHSHGRPLLSHLARSPAT